MKVHVLLPLQAGSLPGSPALTFKVRPQLSVTTGGVGSIAKLAHSTVEPPGLGIVTTGAEMVYV